MMAAAPESDRLSSCLTGRYCTKCLPLLKQLLQERKSEKGEPIKKDEDLECFYNRILFKKCLTEDMCKILSVKEVEKDRIKDKSKFIVNCCIVTCLQCWGKSIKKCKNKAEEEEKEIRKSINTFIKNESKNYQFTSQERIIDIMKTELKSYHVCKSNFVHLHKVNETLQN